MRMLINTQLTKEILKSNKHKENTHFEYVFNLQMWAFDHFDFP